MQYYYGGDINLVMNAPVGGNVASYPGRPLRRGDAGNDVQTLKRQLNRIGKNYPAIPALDDSFVFDGDMEAVRVFQQIFNLAQDGIVGKATWYKIKQIYNGVKQLSDLSSEGLTISELQRRYAEELRLGDSGIGVRTVQNMVKKYAQGVTIKKITPHKLRSTFGTNLYQETGDIYLVADVLGHADVNTTRKHYADIEDSRRRMAATRIRLRKD